MVRALKLIARFLALGGLLFVARLLLASAPECHPEDASDESLLVAYAIEQGWARVDAVVRERLLRGVEVAGEEAAAPGVLVERALALGLERRDPIARQRLAQLARLALEAGPPPTDAELEAHLAAHGDALRGPVQVRLEQVFLSRARHGEKLESVAQRFDPNREGGDPWPWTPLSGWFTEARLDAIFGAGFGAQVLAADAGIFAGPLRSSFGLHWVRISERAAPSEPTLASARARLLDRVSRAQRQERLQAGLAALRARCAP